MNVAGTPWGTLSGLNYGHPADVDIFLSNGGHLWAGGWVNDVSIDFADTATAEFFHNSSSYGATDDNNNHTTNISCDINRSFVSWNGFVDDDYLALANCTFNVWYYA